MLQDVKDVKDVSHHALTCQSSGISGKSGTIMVITWNENFRKLTTSDQSGAEISKKKTG